MNAALALAVGFAHSWVAIYTAGLPGNLREARRSEIDSDLWEQQWLAGHRSQPPLATAGEMAARTLLGMLSDITWRVEAGASSRSKGTATVNNTWPMRIGFLIAMLPLVALTLIGISFLVGNGDWDNTWEHWIWRGFFAALPVIGGLGLWLCAARPVLGMSLVLVGVGTSAFLMPWMAIITVPVGIAIIVFAAFRAGFLPRPSARQPAA